jgi:hypothetical protein
MPGQIIPLDIVGSSTYGRNPKVLASRTFNMITADDWLVDYAGFEKVLDISEDMTGRGIFSSIKADRVIVVSSNKVYSVSIYTSNIGNRKNYSARQVGLIDSYTGDVTMDENIANQIAICDRHNIYIYNYVTGEFTKATLPSDFLPGYVCYKDGYFIAPDLRSSSWALSALNNGLNWLWNTATSGPVLGALENKADLVQAVISMPGKGNLILVMGNRVTELWTDVGASLFPFQKSYTVNIDYGCLNSATIAASDKVVMWLGSNEKSGPVIMFTTGLDSNQVSTDGINYRLSRLINPQKSAAFFIKISGHLVYHLTFYDERDNLTILYDFTDQKFYDATDEKMNYHPARKVAFFDNDYYFVSLNDGHLYRMSDSLSTFNYGKFRDGSPKIYDISRIRIPSNIRLPTQGRFSISSMGFTIEQGNDTDNDLNLPDYQPGIDMSMSKNGGLSFGSYSQRKSAYRVGKRDNRLMWWNLGLANDFVPQFRFFGKGMWRATNGQVVIN